MDAQTILDNVRALSARFATERRERQQRRALDPTDFAHLREAGVPLGVAHHRRGEVDPDRLTVLAHDPPLGAPVLDRAVGQLAPFALRQLACPRHRLT